MLYLRKLSLGLLVGLMAMQTGVVHADDHETGDMEMSDGASDGYPSRIADRPLVLDPMMLEVGLDVSFLEIGIDGADMLIGSNIGVGFGIMDNLEVRADIAPLTLSPDFDYGNPGLGATYRILDGDFELGAGVSAVIPVQDGANFGMSIDVPVILHMDALRIDTGLTFNLDFGDEMVTGMGVPVQVMYNVTDDIATGLVTGFAVATFDAFGDSWAVPLGVAAAYTLAGDSAPTGDVLVSFGFPAFLSAAGDGVGTDAWIASVGYRHFLSL